MSMKNSNDTMCNRTSDLPICITAPSPLCHRGPRRWPYWVENVASVRWQAQAVFVWRWLMAYLLLSGTRECSGGTSAYLRHVTSFRPYAISEVHSRTHSLTHLLHISAIAVTILLPTTVLSWLPEITSALRSLLRLTNLRLSKNTQKRIIKSAHDYYR